jgi:hypothetical protein
LLSEQPLVHTPELQSCPAGQSLSIWHCSQMRNTLSQVGLSALQSASLLQPALQVFVSSWQNCPSGHSSFDGKHWTQRLVLVSHTLLPVLLAQSADSTQ